MVTILNGFLCYFIILGVIFVFTAVRDGSSIYKALREYLGGWFEGLKYVFVYLLIAFFVILFFVITVSAHPGRTDSNGGHNDRSTGEYHYHHGYGPHDHPDGVCPYDYDDDENSAESNALIIRDDAAESENNDENSDEDNIDESTDSVAKATERAQSKSFNSADEEESFLDKLSSSNIFMVIIALCACFMPAYAIKGLMLLFRKMYEKLQKRK